MQYDADFAKIFGRRRCKRLVGAVDARDRPGTSWHRHRMVMPAKQQRLQQDSYNADPRGPAPGRTD
jgi:hypothetical protein